MRKEPVYEEARSELVPATGHGAGIFYRIFLGTVTWDSDPISCIAILMQYGDQEEWSAAVRERQIAFHLPAHVAVQDLAEVQTAIRRVQDWADI